MREDRERWNERYQGRGAPGDASGIVRAYSGLAPPGTALDIASGPGRNALFLARQGFRVEAVDISEEALSQMTQHPDLHPVCADLDLFDIVPGRYSLIVNIRFLDRRLFPQILDGLIPGGVLIFEALLASGAGSEERSRSPRYRLQANELLHAFSRLRIVHYRETVAVGDEAPPTAGLVGIKP